MDLFNTIISEFALPVLAGIAVFLALFFLRRLLRKGLHRLSAKTTTHFDDILIRETNIALILWCVWLGLYTAYKLADTPVAWMTVESNIITTGFVVFGIYTLTAVIMGVLKWYRVEICPLSHSRFDDMIIAVLAVIVPIISSALGVIAVLNLWGFSSDAVNGWLGDHGVNLAVILFITIVLLLGIDFITPRFITRSVRNSGVGQTEEELQKRSDTLISVMVTTLQIVILLIFVIMILSEQGIDITAIIASAGVVGIAVGFGAQSLVKDILAGLFIILENQYRKGDVVNIAGKSGLVEEINLRRTILRDMDGITHVVPNSAITVASNYTKFWSRVNLDISVSYDTDLDFAMSVINRVGQELAEDPQWASAILTPPRALRVNNFGDSGIDIKVLGETKPVRQWEVMGEFRLRLKREFDKEGIEIPWPHVKVYFGDFPTQLIPSNFGSQPAVKEQPKPKAKKGQSAGTVQEELPLPPEDSLGADEADL